MTEVAGGATAKAYGPQSDFSLAFPLSREGEGNRG
jgi:hypothetical protein